ncbi:MAG: hypothetical protein H7Z75_10685, partial [Ferruginibacter sp.]|nr:hypothetical protein [Cytophagales bacterium]
MQDLKELIQFLYQGNPGVFAATFSLKPSKEFVLYQGVADGLYPDDRKAARDLYRSVPEDPRYTKLKARLEDKLLDHLLWVDLGGGKLMADREPLVRCQAQLGQARMLRDRGRMGIAEHLLARALRTARAYEFTTLVLACLEMLLELYAEQGEAARFDACRQLLLHFRNILVGEQEAGLLYQQAQLRLANPDGPEELVAFLAAATHQLQELWRQTRSFDCYDRFYRLYLRQLELEEDYPQILSLVSASDWLLGELKVNPKRFDQRHNRCQWLYACLRTGQVAAGLQLAQTSGSLFNPASREWLEYQENYLCLVLHQGNYTQAEEMIGQAERHPSFAGTSSGVRQRWRLYGAYLHWMHADTRLPLPDPRLGRHPAPFKGTRRPAAQSGGRGRPGDQVAILILEFCHHLKANERDWLLKKPE